MYSEYSARRAARQREHLGNSKECWYTGLPFEPRVAHNDLYPHDEVVVTLRRWAKKKDPYQSTIRRRAWRNMLVAAINAGIKQNLIGLTPHSRPIEGEDAVFDFVVAGIPALGYARISSRGEVRIHCGFWPAKDADRWICCTNADRLAGRAFATSWIERTHGPWLQLPHYFYFKCENGLLRTIAEIEVEPAGYLDRGPIMM